MFFEPGKGVDLYKFVPKLIELLQKETLTIVESEKLFSDIIYDCSPSLTQELIELFGQKNFAPSTQSRPLFRTKP